MTLPDLSTLSQLSPEQYAQAVIDAAHSLPLEALQEAAKQLKRQVAAASDGYDGFKAFYELIHGNSILPHNEEPVKLCFDAHAKGEIFEWLGFRGSRKTTTLDITLATFLHGHHPEKSGVITGANDPNSKLIAKSIAKIIEFHPEFKAVFPYIVIDKDKGWGAEGYWLMDSRMTREMWTAQQAKKNDPSFVGGGYKSSEINGKHPDLYLIVDDLHDIDSSASKTERETIKKTFITQILPTIPNEKGKLTAWVIITGVPFAEDDTYQELRKGGGTVYYELPVMRRASENAAGAVYLDGFNPETGIEYEDLKGWWFLTWPENFPPKTIYWWRSKGKAMFWQMYMIDINTARTAGLMYYSYVHTDIGFDLITVGGADPSGIDPDTEVGGQKRSSFALCYLCKLPQGGAVVKDGVLKPLGIVKAKEAILQAQAMFPYWDTTGVEDVGIGKVFMQYLRTDSRVRFLPSNLKWYEDAKMKDKKLRFLNEIHPWIENGVIRISDENTPYLNALRNLMDNFFDIDPKKPNESLDAGDALYHAAKLIPEVLRMPVSEDISPKGLQRKKMIDPYMALMEGRR